MTAARRVRCPSRAFRFRSAFVAAGLLSLASVVALPAGRASAQADDVSTSGNQNTYSLTAEGDGELYKVVNGQLPASTTEEVSPYSAQAANDSSGNSTAFAGLPYPGPVGSTIEGTINGLSGGATPPLPPAPGFVTVTYPGHPSADESNGPYVVQASAAQYSSTAKAGFGVSPNASGNPDANQQVFSKASVVANPDGSVSATAGAGVDGLNVGVIDALNISSTETITETGSGAPTIRGSTTLGTVQILGFTLGITPGGFDLLGANLALPTSTVLQEINSALGKSGTQMSILPGSVTHDPNTGATIVTSNSLEIVTVQNVPAVGPTTVTYDFGRVTVSAADVATSATGVGGSAAPSAPPADTPLPSSGPPVAPTGAAVTASTGPSNTGIISGASAPSIATAPASGSSDLSNTKPSAGSSSSLLPTKLGYLPAAVTGVSLHGLYLLLVLAGLLAVGTTTVFRHLGIRLLGWHPYGRDRITPAPSWSDYVSYH
jgi:hypothetical protein